VGDFGGGSLYLAFGILAALWERQRSGRGQVVDAAIVDGVASMMSIFAGIIPSGIVSLERDRSLLGGAAPFYRCYECADGRYVSVGAIEPAFYQQLLQKIGAEPSLLESQYQVSHWAQRSMSLTTIFRQRTRDEWCGLLEGTDCCFAPVLRLEEVAKHPHNAARDSYADIDGVMHCSPAPRFSRTPGAVVPRPSAAEVLDAWGVKGPAT
jgi:alpha-methylacyl-CoA racemase